MQPIALDSALPDREPPSNGPGRRLKVCLATWAPFLGGAEVACERLALGLEQAGHKVFVVVGRRGPVLERLEQAGLRCICTPTEFTDRWHLWRYWRSRSALRGLLQRERPDIIHSNDLPTHQALSGAARGLGIPCVAHHRYPFPGTALDWFNKFGAARHLFVSRALMEEICQESSRLRESPRAVVYDGLTLPPRPAPAERQQARRQLGLEDDRTSVLFAGQIVERKGVADLLRAWMLLDADLRSGAELLIIGEDLQGGGQYRQAMQHLAAELHCPARFVGFQKDVRPWLLAADVAVVPSHVEPLGNATLEAMSFALPVIGGAVGGIPEMVVPEETGLLVPPRNPEQLAAALTRLLADPELRRRYGDQGRQRCEKCFSLQAHAQSVLREYAHVIPAATETGRC
jgi:glycosyltransferase involved in cell wall biosynthesis